MREFIFKNSKWVILAALLSFLVGEYFSQVTNEKYRTTLKIAYTSQRAQSYLSQYWAFTKTFQDVKLAADFEQSEVKYISSNSLYLDSYDSVSAEKQLSDLFEKLYFEASTSFKEDNQLVLRQFEASPVALEENFITYLDALVLDEVIKAGMPLAKPIIASQKRNSITRLLPIFVTLVFTGLVTCLLLVLHIFRLQSEK